MGLDKVSHYQPFKIFHYQLFEREWYFNIDKAIELCELAKEAGFTPITVSRASQENILKINYVNDKYVDNADETKPGIAIQIEDERVAEGLFYILIDGTHRCAKAYKLNKDWSAFFLEKRAYDVIKLTDEEIAQFTKYKEIFGE